MKEEILNWLKQAEADLRKAKILFENKEYDGVAFNSHQAVEKALKSLLMHKFKESEKGHSLVYLAKKLDVPEEFMTGIRDLNPEYLVARYPDIAGDIPSEIYDEKIAGRHKQTAENIITWVKKQIS